MVEYLKGYTITKIYRYIGGICPSILPMEYPIYSPSWLRLTFDDIELYLYGYDTYSNDINQRYYPITMNDKTIYFNNHGIIPELLNIIVKDITEEITYTSWFGVKYMGVKIIDTKNNIYKITGGKLHYNPPISYQIIDGEKIYIEEPL